MSLALNLGFQWLLSRRTLHRNDKPAESARNAASAIAADAQGGFVLCGWRLHCKDKMR